MKERPVPRQIVHKGGLNGKGEAGKKLRKKVAQWKKQGEDHNPGKKTATGA